MEKMEFSIKLPYCGESFVIENYHSIMLFHADQLNTLGKSLYFLVVSFRIWYQKTEKLFISVLVFTVTLKPSPEFYQQKLNVVRGNLLSSWPMTGGNSLYEYLCSVDSTEFFQIFVSKHYFTVLPLQT